MPTLMEQEIFSQSTVLKQTYRNNVLKVEALARLIKSRRFPYIMMAARGSSDNACLYFKYLCEIRYGIPVAFIYPSIVTQYDGKLDLKDAILICVSQSGEAFDIRKVMEKTARQGGVTVAITNNAESPLAKGAQHHLCMDVGPEQSMPATKTFTAELLLLGMLVTALERADGMLPETPGRLPELIEEVLRLQPAIDRLAERWTDVREAFVLARGVNLCVSREICCKLQETCYLNATSYALSDFMHGPFALVEPETRVMLVAMNDEAREDALAMIAALGAVGAKPLLFTDSADLAALVEDHVLLPRSDLFLSPFASTVAGQLFACSLAASRGIDPDRSRNIRKVTITR